MLKIPNFAQAKNELNTQKNIREGKAVIRESSN